MGFKTKMESVNCAVGSYHVNTIRFVLALYIKNCAHRKEKGMHIYIKFLGVKVAGA